MDILIKISVVLLVGILGGRLAKLLKLPNVTGYLIGGLLIGPSFLKVINDGDISNFSIVSEVALAAIAFSIGSEFYYKDLVKVGKKIFIVTFFQAFLTIIAVFSTSYFLLNQSFQLSILLGAIAAATAPAATTMVIKQYNANGPLTKTILPVVAIDDAICVMSFGIAMAVVKITTGSTNASLLQMLIHPVAEIFGSLIVGVIIGAILVFLANKAKKQDELQTIVIALVIAGAGLANTLHLSPILLCMSIGATITNLMQNPRRAFEGLNYFTPPVYLFFFTLAGAGLHLTVLSKLGYIGLGYVLARAAGKIIGSAIGAKVVDYPDVIVKYLGLGLLPQAGVAIGLAIVVKQQLPDIGGTLSTIVLGGVFVYELIGPVAAKIAIERAGEIPSSKKTVIPKPAKSV
ncbi:cation:proton antiporter [Alkaliphilus serpentinus]|uniref:Cation:proton antiporter n=1 Tax=Alkaliphilus serpentinus TaxID=1482731 RepID=A0A833HNZ1_9FIRM|nr:cation:proton antiporter [Alkaliphilus serpentinus]KAB3530067.1 cation:proton antiporter [Alkaliphilus serpentinus]